MQRTINNGNPLTWENISSNLEEVCRAGIPYVEDVSTMPQLEEGSINDLLSTPRPSTYLPTPTLQPTPRPIIVTPTPGPTVTPGPTPTGTAYP